MRDIIKKILKESEDDNEWFSEYVDTNYVDFSAGITYKLFGLNDPEIKRHITESIINDFSDLKSDGDTVKLIVDGWEDFPVLFSESRNGGNNINKYLAEQILNGDYYEPYDVSDLIHNWYDQIWDDLVIGNEKVYKEILNYIRKNYVSSDGYNPKQLDIYNELPKKQNVITIYDNVLNVSYFNELSKNPKLLGKIIEDADDFSDLKRELKWCYGDAYNRTISDNMYNATTTPIIELLGEPIWNSTEHTKHDGSKVTKHFMEFDITKLFYNIISDYFDSCWSDYNLSDSKDIDELMEYDRCGTPGWEHSSFMESLRYSLDENNDLFFPRYDDYASDNEIKSQFDEAVFERL